MGPSRLCHYTKGGILYTGNALFCLKNVKMVLFFKFRFFWKKLEKNIHSSEFFKDTRTILIVFEKLTRECFFQIALETIQLSLRCIIENWCEISLHKQFQFTQNIIKTSILQHSVLCESNYSYTYHLLYIIDLKLTYHQALSVRPFSDGQILGPPLPSIAELKYPE